MKRRQDVKLLAAGPGAILGAPMINCGLFRLFPQTAQEYSARTIRLVEASLVRAVLTNAFMRCTPRSATPSMPGVSRNSGLFMNPMKSYR